jgi:hypothetical protein
VEREQETEEQEFQIESGHDRRNLTYNTSTCRRRNSIRFIDYFFTGIFVAFVPPPSKTRVDKQKI